MARQVPGTVEPTAATLDTSGHDAVIPLVGEEGASKATGQDADELLAGQAGAGKLASDVAGAPLRLPHTDWLLHRLQVSGRASVLRAFQLAAAGADIIPWQLDCDQLEEDWFHRLLEPARRTLSLQGARVLARQLREASERRHAVAVARVGHSRACLLDLHALLPVPPDILCLGPDHPRSLAWLWQHWGTTEPLRQVARDTGSRRQSGGARSEAVRLVFWSADWTPWRALAQLRVDWPLLHFDVQPDYATRQ